MKQIKVRCMNGYKEFTRGKLTCEVNEGEELVAELHKESGEYFAADGKGREVYVGCLDSYGKLVLDYDFELVGEGADTE